MTRMRRRRSHCSQCGQPDDKVGRISKRGLCHQCGLDNMESANRQLATKSGPAYNLWLKRQDAGVKKYYTRLNAAIDERARQLEQQ